MRFAAALLAMFLFAISRIAMAADEYEQPPIRYSESTPDNDISHLQKRLDDGDITLVGDKQFGYLPALLKALDVPVESQVLVFSKTSLQRGLITPKTPRALYFNDDVYIGYTQGGAMLEISATDSRLGTVFYTLSHDSNPPLFRRETDNCLQCHGAGLTDDLPGHVLRSVFVDASGLPLFTEGAYRVDQTTPFAHRWGGWYVTGTHGSQVHMGNLVVRQRPIPRPITNADGQNVVDLHGRFPVDRYLTPHSDLVALMVLEHQTQIHNLITRANFTARQALHYEETFNKALGESPDNRLESTTRRIHGAGDDLIEGLLFVKEAPLTAPVHGTSGFEELFPKRGPVDPEQRSLRDFDLKTRLFRYPCSYLIYSSSFDDLPAEMRQYVASQLLSLLNANPPPAKFSHLSDEDRAALREILQATKPELWDWAALPPR